MSIGSYRRWAIVPAAVIVFLCLLRFGNPQWNRLIFMFQAYLYPGNLEKVIIPPPGYTGTWRVWSQTGKLVNEWEFVDGKDPGGMTILRHTDGSKAQQGVFRNGIPEGLHRWWDEHGRQNAEGTFRNGREWTGTFPGWDSENKREVFLKFEEGRLIEGDLAHSVWQLPPMTNPPALPPEE